MAMTVAELVARLRAETGDFTRGMSKAERELSHFGDAAGKMDSRLGKMAKSAATAMSGIGLAFAGATTLVISKGLAMNSMLEKTQLQFETLMGDAAKAERHVKSVFDFAAETPFETAPIIEASRMMQTFGGAALNTEENLRMVGDAAAAASADIGRVAFYVGRAYGAIQAGRPIGEAAMYLQEMSILSGVARNKLEQLQEAGASSTEIWDAFTAALKVNEGAMARQAQSWDGLTSTLNDIVDLNIAAVFKPMFMGLKEILKAVIAFSEHQVFLDFIEKATALMQKWADVIADLGKRANDFVNDGERFGSFIEKLSGYVADLTDGLAHLAPIFAVVMAHFAQAGLSLLPIVGKFFDLLPFPGLLGSALLGLALSTDESRAAFADLGKTLATFAAAIAPDVAQILGTLATMFAEVAIPLAKAASSMAQDLLPAAFALVKVIRAMVEALAPLVAGVAVFAAKLLTIEPLVWALVAGFVAWKAVNLARWVGELTTTMLGFARALMGVKAAAGAGEVIDVLGPAGKLAAGGKVIPSRLTGITTALGSLNPALVAVGAAAGVATVAFANWAQGKAKVRAEVDALTTAIKENQEAMNWLLSGGKSGSQDAFGKTMREQMNEMKSIDGAGLGDAFVTMGFGMGEAADMVAKSGKAFEDFQDAISSPHGVTDMLSHIEDQVKILGRSGDSAAPIFEKLLRLLRSGAIDVKTFQAWTSAVDGVADRMPEVVRQLEAQEKVQKALIEQEMADKLRKEAEATNELASMTGKLTGSYKKLWTMSLSVGELSGEITKAIQGQLDPMAALAKATEKVQEKNENATASLKDWVAEMRDQAAVMAAWQSNLRTLAGAGFGDLAVYLAKQGPESAAMVDQIVGELKKGNTDIIGEAQGLIQSATTATQNAFAASLLVLPELARTLGVTTVEEMEAALGLMPGMLTQIMNDAGAEFGTALLLLDAIAHDKGGNVIESLAIAMNEDQGKIRQAIDGLLDVFAKANITVPVKIAFPDMDRQMRNFFDQYGTAAGPINIFAGTRNANGAIYGENHVAQIAKSATYRLWAEPETGGEAYIPLALSKRGRSLSILGEVARRFGMTLSPLTMGNTGDMPLLHMNDGGLVGTSAIASTTRAGGGEAHVHHHYHNPTNEVTMGRKTFWTLSKLGVGK